VAMGGSTAASSPFVVICQQVGVKVLPSVINAVVSTRLCGGTPLIRLR
jgi:amino acid transporter